MTSPAPASLSPATGIAPQNKYQYQSHRSHCLECRPPLQDHMYWPNVWHIRSSDGTQMHEVRLVRTQDQGGPSPGEVDRCTCEAGQFTKRGEPARCLYHVPWARFLRGKYLEALGRAYGMGELFEGEEIGEEGKEISANT
jgi:hypothetical protein